jgi:hypothetical protein
MRITAGVSVATLFVYAGLAGCRGADPARDLTPHVLRLIALDSLARSFPCAAIRAKLIYDELYWTQRQACAVAGRALTILGSEPPVNGFMAPSDTARVVIMAVTRQRWCLLSDNSDAMPTGRVGPLEYVVLMEATDRPYSIGVVLDARQFAGSASPDAHPRGVWGGSPHLFEAPDRAHPREEGTRCGYDE